MLTRLLPLVALPLLLSACGSATSTDTDTGEDAATSTTGAASGQDPVLVITDLGGYVPPTFLASAPASLVITEDGHVYVPGVTPEIYPGPMISPVMTGQLEAGDLAGLLDEAEEDGLLADPAPGAYDDTPGVTDMSTMTVTFTTDEGTFEHSAYALGFAQEKGAREVLASFVDHALDLAGAAATEPVEPTSLVVTSWQQTEQAADDPAVTVQPWPGAGSTLTQGGCQVITDPALVEALGQATQATVFTQGDQRFTVAARIVVPGDRGCPTSTKSP